MTEIELHKRPLKAVAVLLISICAVAIGFFLVTQEPAGSFTYIIGWVNIFFFGLGLAIAALQMFDKRPQIVINENGIWDRTTKQGLIHWEQIECAYPLNISRQQFVSLDLGESLESRVKTYRWAAAINKAVGSQNVNLQVSQLSIDEATMANFINEMVQGERENRQEIIRKYF